MFSENFKNLRLSRGLTQAQMADKLGLSMSAVSMYEQGRRQPDNHMLKKICEIFSISTDCLLGVNFTQNSKEQSVHAFFDNVTFTLMSQKGLMFDGKIMSQRDKEKIADAIKVAIAVTISETAKKRRK